MPLDLTTFLKPLSDEAPCGEDLRYDRRALEIMRLGEGKPGTQMGEQIIEAEEPDWREVRDGCLELLARSKDLRIAVWFTLASIKMEGFAGLRDGLALIRGYLETFWSTVYPQLDPDDGNDPTERANILSALNTPFASYGDVMRFHERIMEAPLCESRQLGKFGLKDLMIASGTLAAAPNATTTPDLKIIDGAFEETDLEIIERNAVVTDEALQHAKGIEEAFSKVAGAQNAPEMSKFLTLLKDAATQVKRRLDKRKGQPTDGEGASDGSLGSSSGSTGSGSGGMRLDGELSSRDQVAALLDKIYRYYERAEPSSPIPLVMKCCERLVGKRFTDIVKVLTPDAVALLERISTPDEVVPPAS